MSRLKEALEIKLKNELEEISTDLFSKSHLTDIGMFLIGNDWDEDVLASLLSKPSVVRDLAHAFHLDELSSEFFEMRMRQLTLVYASIPQPPF